MIINLGRVISHIFVSNVDCSEIVPGNILHEIHITINTLIKRATRRDDRMICASVSRIYRLWDSNTRVAMVVLVVKAVLVVKVVLMVKVVLLV